MKNISLWAFAKDVLKEFLSVMTELLLGLWRIFYTLIKGVAIVAMAIVMIVIALAVLVGVAYLTVIAVNYHASYMTSFGLWMICTVTFFFLAKVSSEVSESLSWCAAGTAFYMGLIMFMMPINALSEILNAYSIPTLIVGGVIFTLTVILTMISWFKWRELKARAQHTDIQETI